MNIAKAITHIVELITSIANQTNLLALNVALRETKRPGATHCRGSSAIAGF